MTSELSEKNSVSFPAKTVIFKENDFSKDVYLVRKGRVQLFKKVGNRQLMLAEVDPGGIFGELSMIDGESRSATAISVNAVECHKLTPGEFKEGMKSVPDWLLSIARVLAQRLRGIDHQLNLNGPVSNEANVCAILVYLFNGRKESGQPLPLPPVEKKIFELLKLTIAELDEIFAKLQKLQLITLKQSSVETGSVENLEKHMANVRESLSKSQII